MLHELLFALLGFTGDIIVEEVLGQAGRLEHDDEVVVAAGTYKVKDGYDLLREAERDQINRIAPLGWFYVKLNSYVEDYSVGWGIICGTQKSRVYMAAMVQGVSDLLQEYIEDVSYLEQLILMDGPVPLSQVLQHLQKYMLVFPKLYTILRTIESNNTRGCRILDYFSQCAISTGSPLLKQALDRIILRLRVVLVKQIFAWMVHGELEDPGQEFFILFRHQNEEDNEAREQQGPLVSDADTMQDSVMEKLYQAKLLSSSSTRAATASSTSTTAGNESMNRAFDWTMSYYLSLDCLPASHISPRMASKVMFAGKAVKLLRQQQQQQQQQQQSPGSSSSSSSSSSSNSAETATTTPTATTTGTTAGTNNEAYRYLSRGYQQQQQQSMGLTATRPPLLVSTPTRGTGTGNHIDRDSIEKYTTQAEEKKKKKKKKKKVEEEEEEDNESSAEPFVDPQEGFRKCVEAGGYRLEETQVFMERLTCMLQQPDQAVEMLEEIVDEIHDTISGRLWKLLRDVYGFTAFLQVVRNTYLLGQGEVFQALLDGVLALTHHSYHHTCNSHYRYSNQHTTSTSAAAAAAAAAAATGGGGTGGSIHTLEMDNILNRQVLREAAKLVGFESDDSLSDMLYLRVNSADLHIDNFSLHLQRNLQLLGAARQLSHRDNGNGNGDSCLLIDHNNEDGEDGDGDEYSMRSAYDQSAGQTQFQQEKRTMIELCIPAVTSEYALFRRIWTRYLRRQIAGNIICSNSDTYSVTGNHDPMDGNDGGENDSIDLDSLSAGGGEEEEEEEEKGLGGSGAGADDQQHKTAARVPSFSYSEGAVWLKDQKYLSRGFTWAASFSCGWNTVRRNLTASHPFFALAAPVTSSSGSLAGTTATATGRDGAPFPPIGARALLLGSISCCIRGDNHHHHYYPQQQPQHADAAMKTRIGSNRGKELGDRSILAEGGIAGGELGTLAVGATFHAMVLPGDAIIRYFARLYIHKTARQQRQSVGIGGSRMHDSAESENVVLSEHIVDIDENLHALEVDGQHVSSNNRGGGGVRSSGMLSLEVEYLRKAAAASDTYSSTGAGTGTNGDAASVYSAAFSSNNSINTAGYAGAVTYMLRARLVNTDPDAAAAATTRAPGQSSEWHLEIPLELPLYVKCQGGQAYVGVVGKGLLLLQHSSRSNFLLTSDASPTSRQSNSSTLAGTSSHLPSQSPNVTTAAATTGTGTGSSTPDSFSYRVFSLSFAGKGALVTYPVASPFTFSRFPDTFARISAEVGKLRAWMNMKLTLSLPPMFSVIFDSEAINCYERIFATIMKIRLVAHGLERLWIARSRLISDRLFCQIRHSMHFFISNLLYYLQVDVVDSEYSALQQDIADATEFQSVLRAHRTFQSNLLRLSLIDNVSIQEGIERVLQICLRFTAVCRILHQAEFLDTADGDHYAGDEYYKVEVAAAAARKKDERVGGGSNRSASDTRDSARKNQMLAPAPPIYVPREELECIRKDFFTQVSLLFQLMRRVESRGFIFRLDFNGFLSSHTGF